MNYTHPDQPDYEDSPKDWLKSALVFVRAISFMLPEGKGLVIDLQNDMLKYYNCKRVVVWNTEKQVRISEADDCPFEEGTLVTLREEE